MIVSKKIPIYTREINNINTKKNIIITGSHMYDNCQDFVSKILSDQKLDPTIINGGLKNSFNIPLNCKITKGEFILIRIIIITSSTFSFY